MAACHSCLVKSIQLFSFSEDDMFDDMSDDDSGDDWEENNDDNQDILCLFCGESSKGFPTALYHIKTFHKFNFCDFVRRYSHDTYSYIKLINFIRCKKISPEQLSTTDTEVWDKEEYLRPVVEDDPWLMYGKYKEFIVKLTSLLTILRALTYKIF